MSKDMKLILESWRQFSTLESLLRENKVASKINLKKLADIQSKNIDDKEVQQKITNALISDPEVKEAASMLIGAFSEAAKQIPSVNPTIDNELEDTGIQEGVGDLWTRLGAALGSAQGGNMEGALQMIGLGKIAEINPKVLGAAILLVTGTAAYAGGINPMDASKVLAIGAKVGMGGVNAITVEDMQEIASVTTGVDGGKQAE